MRPQKQTVRSECSCRKQETTKTNLKRNVVFLCCFTSSNGHVGMVSYPECTFFLAGLELISGLSVLRAHTFSSN